MDTIRKHVQAAFYEMGAETEQGHYERFNGLDVHQTRDYIKLSCESYLDRVLQTRGWDTPSQKDPDKIVPIRDEVTSRLMQVEGPPEKSHEAQKLEEKHGFLYRALLGELVYAYVICQLDIGFAVCFLSRFSTAPHDEHFTALKHVLKYLRKHKNHGIVYRRCTPLQGLRYVHFEFLQQDPTLPFFPEIDWDELVGLFDAAHATELKQRRSVNGLVLLYCKAAIVYKSRLQTVTATSSTEAEFYAGVTCAKLVRYLRMVLKDLGCLREGPSRCFTDNLAAVHIVNERKPTPRTRHIEVQHFAVQSWREAGEIVMKHFPGVLNPSDDLTKALSIVLHQRHCLRSMGHYGPPLAPMMSP
jgi:hypothetical protein